jgi:dihydrofolate reductase
VSSILPKYVISTTLGEPKWATSGNSTVLRGDVAGEVSKLKQEIAGDIVVYASIRLVHALLEHDLVDEVRLTVYPVVLGAGERLFCDTADKKPMRLVSASTIGDGLAYLTYERAGRLPLAGGQRGVQEGLRGGTGGERR